jgi:hypothetical protein
MWCKVMVRLLRAGSEQLGKNQRRENDAGTLSYILINFHLFSAGVHINYTKYSTRKYNWMHYVQLKLGNTIILNYII